METAEGYKIWKNPNGQKDPPLYMGEFYPPNGQICFLWTDLVELCFQPGWYTVRIPDSVRQSYALPAWQAIRVPE